MRAKGCEPYDHEFALADRFTQPIPFMEASDPSAVTIDPSILVCWIELPVRRAKIQEQRDVGRRKMSFANWSWERTGAREVTSYKRAQLRTSTALRGAPSAQLRCVLLYFESRIELL
jgi:hypothetical protein